MSIEKTKKSFLLPLVGLAILLYLVLQFKMSQNQARQEEVVEQTHGGTPIQLETPSGMLYGTLLQPEQTDKPVPIVLVLAGSGPTDRNCNQLPTLHTDAFRLLAEALQQNGIASVR